jgi:carotenoid biosynthesis protein
VARLRAARALLGGLAAAQVAYGLRRPAAPAATRAIVALMVGATGAEGVAARGLRRGALPAAAAGAIGFAAELVGVATGRPFGRYSYSDKLGPRVGGVPLLAAGAWAALARPAWVSAGWLTPRPLLRVPAAAAALTAWDVFLDPRMAREGYWRWPAGGRYEGVPASNFAGWLATGTAAFAVVAAPDARDDGALALYVWTWASEAFANAALWRRPLTAAAGTLAMGAVAGPALWRRRR